MDTDQSQQFSNANNAVNPKQTNNINMTIFGLTISRKSQRKHVFRGNITELTQVESRKRVPILRQGASSGNFSSLL
jgi:hypothetical protein